MHINDIWYNSLLILITIIFIGCAVTLGGMLAISQKINDILKNQIIISEFIKDSNFENIEAIKALYKKEAEMLMKLKSYEKKFITDIRESMEGTTNEN